MLPGQRDLLDPESPLRKILSQTIRWSISQVFLKYFFDEVWKVAQLILKITNIIFMITTFVWPRMCKYGFESNPIWRGGKQTRGTVMSPGLKSFFSRLCLG